MTDIKMYLEKAVNLAASDLFIVAGAPISYKVKGQICDFSTEKLSATDTEKLVSDIYSLAERAMDSYTKKGDDDFSFAIAGLARFRVSTYRQRGSLAAVIRVVAFDIPDYKDYKIPDEVMALSGVTNGLILFTGTAGSGKSTTQACLIDRINHTRNCHIITLEDPIEFLHRNDKSIISQREIAIDTADCLSGLRACLRQTPDVILLGEMRDAETIHTAMTAAETGHTVIATLHTKGTANSIDRIIDAFPASQHGQIRVQLASVLHTVVSQQLLPGKNDLVPAFEIMHTNSAIRNMIREGKTHQLAAAIASSGSEGMLSMDSSILELYKSGDITKETALTFADNPEQLLRRI
ncbi:MAG: PilT/PilU family type 4a pilus ATPase [Ruminococcaceae bacterium]|nr:PilT/PilU family type 4a pilus ATPase [Oscillospiraceae bacterium]